MATATDTPAKTDEAQNDTAPARARKASAKSAAKSANGNAALKRARKSASAKAAPSTVEKIAAAPAAAGKSVASAASGAAQSVRSAAGQALDAVHVPAAAKTAAAKVRAAPSRVRKAVAPAKTKKKGKPDTSKRSGGVGAGTILGVAAAGLAAGIAANLGRKAAVQAPSVMAGDWFEALKAEHKMALTLMDKLAQSRPEQPARRTLLLTQLKHALGKHAFTEENVIYPALREWGDKADADALNHEHGYVKQYLYELENIDKSAPEFASKVAELRADLDKHIRDEEDKIFPKIHEGLGEEKNKLLTAQANKEGFKLA